MLEEACYLLASFARHRTLDPLSLEYLGDGRRSVVHSICKLERFLLRRTCFFGGEPVLDAGLTVRRLTALGDQWSAEDVSTDGTGHVAHFGACFNEPTPLVARHCTVNGHFSDFSEYH